METEEPKREHLNRYKKRRFRKMYRWFSTRLPFALIHEKYEQRDDETEIRDAVGAKPCESQDQDID